MFLILQLRIFFQFIQDELIEKTFLNISNHENHSHFSKSFEQGRKLPFDLMKNPFRKSSECVSQLNKSKRKVSGICILKDEKH